MLYPISASVNTKITNFFAARKSSNPPGKCFPSVDCRGDQLCYLRLWRRKILRMGKRNAAGKSSNLPSEGKNPTRKMLPFHQLWRRLALLSSTVEEGTSSNGKKDLRSWYTHEEK
ncbi:hypothetical protein FNV43_RR13126 [Rhamnella rubrinervis]|uniref:Uncharacterized protein n=1 Tax=Rhamnella rubrinervis TaxID=2594499 RepID=A0A8K0H0I2_9ROSA|nr:hypothetical protein FNV43_RR13126 [Rhamnella rubrinervis]